MRFEWALTMPIAEDPIPKLQEQMSPIRAMDYLAIIGSNKKKERAALEVLPLLCELIMDVV